MIFFAFIQNFFVLSIFCIIQVVSFKNFVKNSKSSIFRVAVPSILGDGTFPTPPITMRFKSGCARKVAQKKTVLKMYSQIFDIFSTIAVIAPNVIPPKATPSGADFGVRKWAADRGHMILSRPEVYSTSLHRPILLRRGREGGFWWLLV